MKQFIDSLNNISLNYLTNMLHDRKAIGNVRQGRKQWYGSKAVALPKFSDTLTLSQLGEADYAQPLALPHLIFFMITPLHLHLADTYTKSRAASPSDTEST